MGKYDVLESRLNAQEKIILRYIKEDYYDYFSEQKKQVLDELIESERPVIVDYGDCPFKHKTIAHSGRGKKDGRIHFYPDIRSFPSYEEMIDYCQRILPHETFHFFVQPDAIKLKLDSEKYMANEYTEGAVENEARRFCERHPDIPFSKALCGFMVRFVNTIQGSLGATNYETIFSEADYLKNIGKYESIFKEIKEEERQASRLIGELTENLPFDLRKEVRNRLCRRVCEDGSIDSIQEAIKSGEFHDLKITKKSNDNDEIEI